MAGLDLASAAAAQLSGDTLQCLGRIEAPAVGISTRGTIPSPETVFFI